MTAGDEFINSEIPRQDRALFPKIFKSAYDAVDELVASTPFLKCPPARMAVGHLKAWAVDFAVSQLIESGRWKVDYEWAWFDRPTGQYLRIFTSRAVVTVSQVENGSSQPRQADFRDNAAYDNQPDLFLLPGEKSFLAKGKPHLILIHGYQELKFIHVGMPNPESNPTWLGLTGNVLGEIYDASTGLPAIEGPEVVSPITIKEQLKKQIRENGI